MKRVLFIAYFFPPQGGGGVQRSLKFVKYLPDFGFEPLVLTGSGECGRWSPSDAPLLRELRENTRVHRIADLPYVLAGSAWGRRLRDLCGLPRLFGAAWRRGVLREGARLCREERPDCIYVSLSPFEGAAAAAALSRQFGIPWVADLRDPWALDEMQSYISGVHRAMACATMRRQLSSAAVVIMNTPEAAHQLRERFPEFKRKVVMPLTNGYDAEDVADRSRPPVRKQFTIVHTGTLHAGTGETTERRSRWNERLGRTVPGVHFLSRSHAYLLQALERLLDTDPQRANRIRLVLAGVESEADRSLVVRSRAAHLVEFIGFCTQKDALKLQQNADLLFLPMHGLPPGRRATIVPGKTYEYLATGRPILAAVPEGDARDFVLSAGSGRVCDPVDVDTMVALIRKEFDAWSRHEPAKPFDWDYIQRFERRELTRRLASHLEAVLREPTRPVEAPHYSALYSDRPGA